MRGILNVQHSAMYLDAMHDLFQVATIRKHLAKMYEDCQQWREAARVLTGIPLETGQR